MPLFFTMFSKLLLPLFCACAIVSAQGSKQSPAAANTQPDPAARVSLRPHDASCGCITYIKGMQKIDLDKQEPWLFYMGIMARSDNAVAYNPCIEDIYKKRVIPVLLSPDYPFRAFLDEAKTKSPAPNNTNAAACQIEKYLAGLPLEVYATNDDKDRSWKARTELRLDNHLQIGVNLPVWWKSIMSGRRKAYKTHPDKEFCTTLAHEFGHAFLLANFPHLNYYQSPTNKVTITDETIKAYVKMVHESFAEYITYLSYNSYFIQQHNSYTELQKADYVLKFLESSLEKNANPHGIDPFYVFSVLVFLKAENDGPNLVLKYDFNKLVEYNNMLQVAKAGNKNILPEELRTYIDWTKWKYDQAWYYIIPLMSFDCFWPENVVYDTATEALKEGPIKNAIEKSLDHIKNHLGGKVPQKCYESDNIIERITFGKR